MSDAHAEVAIEPKVAGKGRAFRAVHLASVTADALWDGGKTDTDAARPIFACFAGTEGELRPFVANLLLGRKALSVSADHFGRKQKEGAFEFLKSAGYKVAWQREEEGAIATVYMPELVLLDPGMVDPKVAQFVMLPSLAWAAGQDLKLAQAVKYVWKLPRVRKINQAPKDSWQRERWEQPLPSSTLTSLVPLAYLFATYLDRRTRAPIPPDGRFYLQFLVACLAEGLASLPGADRYASNDFGRHGGPHGFVAKGLQAAGFAEAIMFRANHEQVEALLADEISTFYALTEGK